MKLGEFLLFLLNLKKWTCCQVGMKVPLSQQGVDKFSRHSPDLQVVQHFYSPSQKTTGQQVKKQLAKYIERVSERKKNSWPDWRVGLYFYSPILNFTHIWRVGEWLSLSHCLQGGKDTLLYFCPVS
jgi:hypothetical protein